VSRAKDEDLLHRVLEEAEISDAARAAFEDMQQKLVRFPLTPKQRAWAEAVLRGDRYEGEDECLNLWSSGKVPKGRDVPTPPVLQNLPLKPPGRK
jgi:hypothetical protein